MIFITYLFVVYVIASLLIGLFITTRLDGNKSSTFNEKDRWELITEFVGCWIAFAMVWPLMLIAVLTERKQ